MSWREFHSGRRMPAWRVERIRRMIARLLARPGARRAELAAEYSLSQRQMQADLTVIADTVQAPRVMALVELGPLGRDRGYRFGTGTVHWLWIDGEPEPLPSTVTIATTVTGAPWDDEDALFVARAREIMGRRAS